MKINELSAITPTDGRYANQVSDLQELFSEYALIKYRVSVEIKWFIHLSNLAGIKELPKLKPSSIKFLNNIIEKFDLTEANKVKKIEKKINHDVKAVEYYLKKQFNSSRELNSLSEFIHFGCTSEDINNISYALMVKDASNIITSKKLKELNKLIKSKAKRYSNISMISRTHGQLATPTTVGKEFANFSYRIDGVVDQISSQKLKGKMNGAVGNYNAHIIAYPKLNWERVSKTFVSKLGLEWSAYTTQVEPKDHMVGLFLNFFILNNILIDLSRDLWGYISLDYFSQETLKGEVGSSTMPHKVNPIDFENAEGNLGIANSLFLHMSSKITISRWQRDLSDSTTMRNIGACFAHTQIALISLTKGLNKIEVNKEKINYDLKESWEVLTEAIQTVMRKHRITEGYEEMKKASRGKRITKDDLHSMINGLDIPKTEKELLLKITPSNYIGLARKLAKEI